MPSCFFFCRSKTSKSKSENISFHKFPSKECILQKWHDFILSHNLSVNKIKKISLIYSLNFVPESFIVYNKNRLLQKHALPTIKISRVKGGKSAYPELKETLSLPKHESSTSKLHMERILVKMFQMEETDEVFDVVIRYGLYLVAIFQLVCITTVFLLTDQSNDSKDNGDGSEYDSDGSTFASPRRPYSHHRSRKQDKKKRR